jgi:RsiW-degrading membrane proteinase PrsW (M82 family)
MFWVVVNKNKHFDEHVDGVVYASCVALGFAGIENILYLFDNTDEWVSVGIVRALLAVPMHWGCGILMGYYFSLVHFGLKNDLKTKVMILAAPIICHGIYDSLLFSVGVEPLLGLVIMPFLIFFLVKFHKRCRQKIVALLQSDVEVMLEQARREAEMQEDNV